MILNDVFKNIIRGNQNLQNIEHHLSFYLKKNLELPLKLRNEKCGGKVEPEEENLKNIFTKHKFI